jgi:hypothetical protein
MAFRVPLLVALALAFPVGRPVPSCSSIPTASVGPQEQARLLLAEWRKAIRTADTPDDWAVVDAIAREVSRLAAPRHPARARWATADATHHPHQRCFSSQ